MNTNYLKSTLTLLVIAGACSCSAQQDAPGQGPNEQRGAGGPPTTAELMKMDLDGDGLLSRTEIKGPLLNDFDKVDANEDGYLSEAELEKAPKPQGGQRPPR